MKVNNEKFDEFIGNNQYGEEVKNMFELIRKDMYLIKCSEKETYSVDSKARLKDGSKIDDKIIKGYTID